MNYDRIYKCPTCGEPLIVGNWNGCPWYYDEKTKKWEHKCPIKTKKQNESIPTRDK